MMNVFASLRLTIALLTILAILSVWGTLAPHLNIYYHPGYLSVLWGLAVNIMACTLPRLLRGGRRLSLRKSGYFLTHLGILIILAGALISLVRGTRTLIWLEPGASADRLETPRGKTEMFGFTMTLDSFRLELHPNGMPQEFVSEVTLRIPEKPEKSTTITVNHPLKMAPYTFFQSSYRMHRIQTVMIGIGQADGSAFSTRLTIPGPPVQIGEQQGVPVMMTGLRYEPDFVVGPERRIGSRSPVPRNPAVLIRLSDGGDDRTEQWLFLNHPDAHSGSAWKGMRFTLDQVDHVYDTGLEVVRDPGTGWVASGALFLVLGLLLYLIPVRKEGETADAE